MIQSFLSSKLVTVALILALIAAIGWIYYEGKSTGKAACEGDQVKTIIKEVKAYDQKKQEIRNLDDGDLIRRYCASSVFDIPYDQCLRSVTYVE